MGRFTRFTLPCLMLLATTECMALADDTQPPCPYPCKPAAYVVPPGWTSQRIAVKFNDGLSIRLREGKLSDLGTGQLVGAEAVLARIAASGGNWSRTHTIDEALLDQLRLTATKNLGKATPDLNLQYLIDFPAGFDATPIIDALNALPIVEMAQATPLPMRPPTPPDMRNEQFYLNINTDGFNAAHAWAYPGGTGSNVRVCDIEYSFNASHIDLPSITILGPAWVDPFSDNNHGTAVLGELFSLNNGWGTTGACHGAARYFAASNTASGFNLAGAISTALGTLTAGDVILIEQQTAGPNFQACCWTSTCTPGTDCRIGLIPSEWDRPVYDAIVTAVGNLVTVVEAAGNGLQNLDDSVYSTGNGGHWPFLPANDSGAIIVGAGAAPVGGTSTDRSRLDFSNYGATVDLQGQGEGVVTTGYGDRYNTEGTNALYTRFDGTSSASPNVAAACAIYQSLSIQRDGWTLAPWLLRDRLIAHGSPQQSGTFPATQHIGPRPNLMATAEADGLIPAPMNDECDGSVLVTGGGVFEGTLFGATHSRDATCGSSQLSHDVWYYFQAPLSVGGTLFVSTCGTHDTPRIDMGPDMVLTLFDDCYGPELYCNDDASDVVCGFPDVDQGVARDSLIFYELAPDQRIGIRVAAFDESKPGPFRLDVAFTPGNDEPGHAVDVSGGGPRYGTLAGAGPSDALPAPCGESSDSPDVWFRLGYFGSCGPTAGFLITTCGTHDIGGVDQGMDTVLAVYDTGLTQLIACNDDATSGQCEGADQGTLRDSRVLIALNNGEERLIRVSPYSMSAGGAFVLNVELLIVNDRCVSPTSIEPGDVITFCNLHADTDGNPDVACLGSNDDQVGSDVWYLFTPIATDDYSADTCEDGFDTKIAVYSGYNCPPAANSAIACNDDSPTCGEGSRGSAVTFRGNAGVQYLIRVGGYTPPGGVPTEGVGRLTLTRLCRADFDDNDTVAVPDIFTFLSAWFAHDVRADFDGNSVIEVPDIFSFLSAWFAGC